MEHDSSSDHSEGTPEREGKIPNPQSPEMMSALAGIIAHDLNNELTVILGNVCLTLEALEPDHSWYPGLLEAQQAAYRCVGMTRGLLNMGQSVKPELKPVLLDRMLRGTERILRKVSSVPTHFTRYTQLPTVMADAAQIQHVILNLAANASRALKDGSMLEVQARNGPKFVTISISISNAGRLPNPSKRLFEQLPPAQTQDSNGFGLTRDVEIVRAHRGFIDMARDSTFITFRISLPSMNHGDRMSTGTTAASSVCVLIADDKRPVRRAAVQTLLRKGYNVMEASDGEEAVRIFAENTGSIDLVFLDMTMPGLSGVEALEQMREICPHVKALLASGHPGEIPVKQFLPKPYSPLDLIRRIQDVLTADETDNGESRQT